MNSFFRFIFLGVFCAANACAQPLLSWMEEGDKVHLRLWVSGCFQVEDNVYQFEMKEGKILCTGYILPDYVLPQRHPRVPTSPIELTPEQIAGIDSDIVHFRQTPLRYHRKAATGVTVIKRNSDVASTTMSQLTLTFFTKGKLLIEESIGSSNLDVLYHDSRKGIAALKQILQQQMQPELDRIKLKVSEEAQQRRAATADAIPAQ